MKHVKQSILILSAILTLSNCAGREQPTPQDSICSIQPVTFAGADEVAALSEATLKGVLAVNCAIIKRCRPDDYDAICSPGDK